MLSLRASIILQISRVFCQKKLLWQDCPENQILITFTDLMISYYPTLTTRKIVKYQEKIRLRN